jgi:hypothetical protein
LSNSSAQQNKKIVFAAAPPSSTHKFLKLQAMSALSDTAQMSLLFQQVSVKETIKDFPKPWEAFAKYQRIDPRAAVAAC